MTNRHRLSYFLAGIVLLLLTVLPAFAPRAARAQEPPVWPVIVPVQIAAGLDEPMYVTHAGDGSGRIFVVQKDGAIRIIANGTVLPTPFLNIDPLVGSSGSEQGLFSMAFSPDYETSGRFYVNYTNNVGDTVIARYRVSNNPNVADPNSAQEVLFIDQPFANHNGGQLQFGDDGMLYIGMGDGGSGGDPQNRAQNPGDLLGKILRINVDVGNPATYTIPADNPFVGQPGFRGEIWHMGTRNPWRFSFDRLTYDMYIGDVGQNQWEEIDFQPTTSTGGEKWGWRCYEGEQPFNTTGCQPAAAYDFPVHVYSHTSGRCSVTGGYVYRGGLYPRMEGRYFFADFCGGQLYGMQFFNNAWVTVQLHDFSGFVTSFGEDEAGNVYVAEQGGAIFRLTDPAGTTPTATGTGVPPTNTPPNMPTATATTQATNTPMPPTNTPAITPTRTPKSTRTPANTPTVSPTNTPATPTNTPAVTPTRTVKPTRTPTRTPTPS